MRLRNGISGWLTKGAADLCAELAVHGCGWKGTASRAQKQPSLAKAEPQRQLTLGAANPCDAGRAEPPGTPG